MKSAFAVTKSYAIVNLSDFESGAHYRWAQFASRGEAVEYLQKIRKTADCLAYDLVLVKITRK